MVGPDGSSYAGEAKTLAARLGLREVVTFTGMISDRELGGWYERALEVTEDRAARDGLNRLGARS